MIVVLAGNADFVAVAVIQRPQQAIAPAGLIGNKHDAPRIADQQDIVAVAPFAFKLGELEFDHHRPEEAAVRIEHSAGQKIPRDATGHAHRVKAAAALAAGLAEVGPEAVVVAHIAVGGVPVAGGHCQPAAVEQFQGRGLRRAVDAFQFAVEGGLYLGRDRVAQGVDQFGVQRQHGRQGAIALDQGVQ